MLTPITRRTALPILAFAAVLGLATSCIHVNQTLTLNPDGSGSLALRYGMSLENIAQMEAMSKQAAEEQGVTNGAAQAGPFDFDEAEVRKDFEQYKSAGVTLDTLKTEVVDGWKYLDLALSFKSLEGLAQTEFVSDRGISLKKLKDGNYEFRQSAPPDDQGADGKEAGDMMAQMMKGFHAVISVVVPSTVVESDADRTDGQTVTWEFDLSKDPKALERAQKMDLRVVFEGQGLTLPDFQSNGSK